MHLSIKGKRSFKFKEFVKNVTKVKKIERKIPSVFEKKTIQFNKKWKSTDLKITV